MKSWNIKQVLNHHIPKTQQFELLKTYTIQHDVPNTSMVEITGQIKKSKQNPYFNTLSHE